MLERLIYTSSADAPQVRGEADLRPILAASRRNNPAHGVTGLLLYADGSFLQILEGERGGLEAILSRIRRDGRHRHISILTRNPAQARAFPDWAMGYQGGAAAAGAFDLTRKALAERIDAAREREIEILLKTFYRTSLPYAAA